MKKIKYAFIITISFIIAFVLPLVAYAHPGKTDSSGGHIDNSTGEYHYHHGYPAHSHYDMDCDGDIDCPYDFDDQTGTNSGGPASDNASSTRFSSSYTDNAEVRTKTVTKTVTKEVPYIPTWIYWVMGILGVVCIILMVNIHWKNDELRGWETRYRSVNNDHEKKVSEIKQTCSAKIEQNKKIHEQDLIEYKSQLSQCRTSIAELSEENASLKNKYLLTVNALGKSQGDSSIVHTIEGLEFPKGVYLINGTTPVKGRILDRKPYGEYTVYVAERGKCYHADCYCGSGLYNAKHIFEVLEKKVPCRKCVYSPPKEIPEWYKKLKSIKK